MSTLSQFAPFAGGGLKSFQTGFIQGAVTQGSITTNNEDIAYTDVTVSSVSTTKSITSFEGSIRAFDQIANYLGMYSTSGGYNMGIVTSRMTSATNLRLASVVWSAPAISGRWKIAEAN